MENVMAYMPTKILGKDIHQVLTRAMRLQAFNYLHNESVED